MGELFATCLHSDYEDISNWYSSQDILSLMQYRESAREDLDKAKIDNIKEVLGRCYGPCTRAGNADGVVSHLDMFIPKSPDLCPALTTSRLSQRTVVSA